MPCSAYTCLAVCKNHLLIFSSFLDIWENVEWPRFLDHPAYYRFERNDKDANFQQDFALGIYTHLLPVSRRPPIFRTTVLPRR